MADASKQEDVHLAVDLGASSGRVIAGFLDQGKLNLEVVHRFANNPVRIQDSLQWDVVGLWEEIIEGLRLAATQYSQVSSVGVDTWGVDFVLLNQNDEFAGPVRCYRDARNVGMIEEACQTVPRAEIFAATGLQFMVINSLYQLLAAQKADDPSLKIADGFLMMGDFFHWLLSGKRSIEVTNASTTQMLNPRDKKWHAELISKFGLPVALFSDPVDPGTVLGNVQPSVAAMTGLENVPVVVPATHDTASAVLAVPAEDFAPAEPTWCYISSGTWSLMGCELPEPMINEQCAALNFTNEGGVSGSTRLLKNIGGLWVFQQIRKSLERQGAAPSWEEMVQAAQDASPFELLLNPDDPALAAPVDMIEEIDAYAVRTGQGSPANDGILFRAALEGLALRYRACLGMLESLVGHRIETIHIVGGGSLNEFLCQMTADACDRTVVAGPVEATAIGNLLMQMMGTGKLESVSQARALVRSSFDTKRFEPQNPSVWTEPAERFAKL
ncbi:MAG: rhamnulokinase family protein [Rubripirellula sp.]